MGVLLALALNVIIGLNTNDTTLNQKFQDSQLIEVEASVSWDWDNPS